MRLLLDTHILIWATSESRRLNAATLSLITDNQTELFFSAASIWEIAIKYGNSRETFGVEPLLFRKTLLEEAYEELAVTGAHGAAVAALPPIHKDPFDRMLAAQAAAENILLLTGDPVLARYPGPIRLV